MRLVNREYCAYQGHDLCTWFANDPSEITPDFCPESACGSTILCVATKDIFIKNTENKWQKFGTTEVI